jgi:hypothetical protein
VGTVPESRETSEQGAIRSNRTVGEGFFAGGGTIDEAILMQLYEVAEKGHQNALACIEWYQNERVEFEKQKQTTSPGLIHMTDKSVRVFVHKIE